MKQIEWKRLKPIEEMEIKTPERCWEGYGYNKRIQRIHHRLSPLKWAKEVRELDLSKVVFIKRTLLKRT